jgi:hypothetical protein
MSGRTLVPLGSPNQVSLEELKARFAAGLEDDWQKTQSVIQAAGELKPSPDQATKALEELAKEGIAERDPPISSGKIQGKTYKWRRVQNLTSDTEPHRSEVKLEGESHGGQRPWSCEL